MILFLLILPLIAGLASFLLKNENQVKINAILSSVIVTAFSIFFCFDKHAVKFSADWLPQLGSTFSLEADGMSKMLCLLTSLIFTLVFFFIKNQSQKDSNSFYGLMLLTQAGLMGVFLAADMLLFYFFWELALIPVYFLCSKWGGERRIQITFKFFIYTFFGSLLMLVGILYLHSKTLDHSFAMNSFYNIPLEAYKEKEIFLLFFIAFAIKMPIFPFHTWQPDTYETSPNAVTMILSALMVKMGIFAVIRWLLPVFPHASISLSQIIIILSVIGMIYASLIAFKQSSLKRLIAYSSIAHIGLMAAALFTSDKTAMQGVMVQMFGHGINVLGLWMVADILERQTSTRNMYEMGGIASKAPSLAIFMMLFAFANIALPLTNSFVGEFMMFNGLFSYNYIIAAFALLSIILAAVYTLYMVQKVLYGTEGTAVMASNISDINLNTKIIFSIIVVLILALGIYPKPLISLTNDTVTSIFTIIKR